MVMQDPMTSLNPLKKSGKQIQESIEHHQGLHGEAAKKAAIEMLAKVGIQMCIRDSPTAASTPLPRTPG